MKEILDEAYKEVNELKHKFMTLYKKDSKIIYIISEGKEDQFYYSNFIQEYLPDETWDFEFIYPNKENKSSSNKNKVLKCLKSIDWRKYNNKQIIFCIDRDLSDFETKKLPNLSNLYITDGYSIENSLINSNTFIRAFFENCHFCGCTSKNKDLLRKMYNDIYSQFYDYMINIMGWILFWKFQQLRPNLNNIEIKKLFQFSDFKLECNSNFNSEYLHKCANVTYNKNIKNDKFAELFKKVDKNKNLIRGKYLLELFIELCKYVDCNYTSFNIQDIQKISKCAPQLSFIELAHIAKKPKSLHIFLENTIKEYIGS